MAHTRHTSFLDLSPAAFKTFARNLVKEHATQEDRQRVFAYLSKIIADDKKLVDSVVQKSVRLQQAKKFVDRLMQRQLSFADTDAIFAQTTLTNAQVATLVQSNNAHVYADGRTLAGLAVNGANVTLDGLSANADAQVGSAKLGTLAPGGTIAGPVTIQGSNVVLRNLTIAPGSGDETFKFSGPTDGIIVENCIFDGTGTDGIWWYGPNLRGNVTIRNCLIRNYMGHWLLGDLTTSSSAPTTKLDSVLIEDCKFEGVEASFAIRGKLDEPTDEVIIRNNEWSYGAVHSLFWSTIEVNNAAFVQVLNNKVTGMQRLSGKARGFLQTWSKATNKGNWVLNFAGNEITGYDFAVQSANAPGFYCMNAYDPDYLITSEAGKLGDTTYGMSWYYESGNPNRWFTGVWQPENISDYADPPATSFADKPNVTI